MLSADTRLPLVFFYGGAGDQILATPALRAISRRLRGRFALGTIGADKTLWHDVGWQSNVVFRRDGSAVDPGECRAASSSDFVVRLAQRLPSDNYRSGAFHRLPRVV